MKSLLPETQISGQGANLARRNFLRSSLTTGLAVGLVGAGQPARANASIERSAANPCEDPSAASILGLFSVLAWKLPNKLTAADEARQRESDLYRKFDLYYKELVELVKKLEIECSKVSKSDPAMQDIVELADAGISNVRFLKTASTEDSNIAYLHLATLIAAGKQIVRTAEGIQPPSDDSQTICKIIQKIGEMDSVKAELDIARSTFQATFKTFVDTIGNVNKTILAASNAAAQAFRGETNTSEAIAKIEQAQRILKIDLEDRSVRIDGGMITPDELGKLLEVPKTLLRGPNPLVTQMQSRESSLFRKASYSVNAAATARERILEILRTHLIPSDSWTIGLLCDACLLIIKLYVDNPPRRNLVRSALQCGPWLSSNSDIEGAAAKIVEINT